MDRMLAIPFLFSHILNIPQNPFSLARLVPTFQYGYCILDITEVPLHKVRMIGGTDFEV